jgi:tRNA nucleotidyltransferase (CCA-adding enzyme)
MISNDQIQDKIPLYVKRVADILVENGFEAYLVGGSVRDLLLGKEPSDFDIATNALPEEIQKVFSKTIATGAKFGTITVVMEDRDGERYNVEVTTYRVESEYLDSRWPSHVEFSRTIGEDLKRRDFTINALAISMDKMSESGIILEDVILDLFGGINDLDAKIIRAVGSPKERFIEDSLRTLRACRFASQLDFEIEENTKNEISQVLYLVRKLSMERVRDEISKILLKSPRPSKGIELMRQTGLLELFIPELIEGIGVTQPEFHTDDVYSHILKVVDLSQDDVKLAALFHDIGKPRVMTHDENGTHFYQHDIVSAKMAVDIMTRLKFSKKDIERTSQLVRHHMFYYPSADWRKVEKGGNGIEEINQKDLDKLRREGQMEKIVGGWTDAAVRRFIIRAGGMDNVNDLIELRIADATANPKSTFSTVEIKALQERIAKVLAEDAAMKVSDLDINGDDLIKLGVPKGPEVGRVLNALFEMVMDNPELNKKETLISIINAKLNDKK